MFDSRTIIVFAAGVAAGWWVLPRVAAAVQTAGQ